MSEPAPEPQPTEPTEPTEPTPDVPTPDEADAAEAEEEGEPLTPDGEPPPPEPEPEPEPEPQPEASGPQEAEWEDFWKKSERSFATYKRTVLGNYPGAEGELIEVSISPSAPPGFLNLLDAGRVPDDVQAPIKEFFGLARPLDYKPDPETRACDTCEGEGKTATGSRVHGNETRKCPTCMGYGYTPPPTQAQNGEVPAAELHAPVGEGAAALSGDDRDVWGEAKLLPDGRENPNYGKMPNMKVQVPPWGTTANLTAQDAAPVG